MRTTVLIPAYNEAGRIQATLDSLPRDRVQPMVVVNGPDDGTAAIARHTGATVHCIEERGKLPAIQHGLRELGKQALEPLMLLDADTHPVFPQLWHKIFVRNMTAQDGPAGIGGPIIYTGEPLITAIARSTRRNVQAALKYHNLPMGKTLQYGPNMGLKLHNDEALSRVLAVEENLWPGEDRALADLVIESGGTYLQTIHPGAVALTPTSAASVSVQERLDLSYPEVRALVTQRYIERGPADANPYTPGMFSPSPEDN